MTDPRLGAVPVAAVELRAGCTVDEAELLEHLRTHLAGYKIPVAVCVVDDLPRTPSMKVSQPGVRAMFERPDSQ